MGVKIKVSLKEEKTDESQPWLGFGVPGILTQVPQEWDGVKVGQVVVGGEEGQSAVYFPQSGMWNADPWHHKTLTWRPLRPGESVTFKGE